MTITLYADDLDALAPLVESARNDAAIRSVRVLPHRCPEGHNQLGRLDCLNCWDGEQGRGWLYPPVPAWWGNEMWNEWSSLADVEWEDFCDATYRVLGIVDD